MFKVKVGDMAKITSWCLKTFLGYTISFAVFAFSEVCEQVGMDNFTSKIDKAVKCGGKKCWVEFFFFSICKK